MGDYQYTEEEKALLTLYVEPHTKISREVVEADLPFVLEESLKMHKLCYVKRGLYPRAFAIAHSQINNKDPLRFFVTSNGDIIINPEIVRHLNYLTYDIEGCLSFPMDMPAKVGRWKKIVAEYVTIDEYSLDSVPKFSKKITAKLKGLEARIFQHEVGHGLGQLIYDIT